MKMMTLEEQFKISFNFLLFFLLVEGIVLSIEVYKNGFTDKAFFYLGFIIFTRLSQLTTLEYFKRLENKK